MQIGPLSADNRCLLGQEFHFTIPVAVRANGYSGADRPADPVVSRQSLPARVRIPFHDTCSSSSHWVLWCRSPRCQPTIELAGLRFPFHDTYSYSCLLGSGADNPVVSRQSSSLGSDFHFTIPVAVPASGFSGADQPVVSRQSSLLGAGFSFHDTCSSSGQRILWCRSARCQPTIEAS